MVVPRRCGISCALRLLLLLSQTSVLLWAAFERFQRPLSSHLGRGERSDHVGRSDRHEKMADNSKLRSFPDRILDIGEVRSHFSSAPCCNNNCMEKIFCMPVDPLAVPLASTVQRINKESVSSSSSSTPDDEYGAKLRTYEALLKAVRWQLAPFRRDDGNTHAVTDFLTEHLTEKQNPTSGRWLYDFSVAGKNYEVCRTAWMGVMGVTANELHFPRTDDVYDWPRTPRRLRSRNARRR